MPYSIYTLSDPYTRDIFYVGLTLNLKNRLPSHRYEAVKLLAAKKLDKICQKDYSILILEKDPICHVIEEVYGCISFALTREKFWINFLMSRGFPLVNNHKSVSFADIEFDVNDLPKCFNPFEISLDTGERIADSIAA